MARRLAALEACQSCPLSRLELRGAVPLSGAVAEAVEACCPQLDCIHVQHDCPHSWVERTGEAAAAYNGGCVQLLTLCGPRLRELRLLEVHGWQPVSYMSLRRCTALVSLELDTRWHRFTIPDVPPDLCRSMLGHTLRMVFILIALDVPNNALSLA